MGQAGDTADRITFKSAVEHKRPREAELLLIERDCSGNVDDYAGVARGHVEIHLWRCADKYIAENTACRVNVDGIEALYGEYRPRRVIHPDGALETRPWGVKEFTVLDLDGNGITFCEPA